MLKVAVIGTGYVGLVSGTCLAEFGNHVTCVDVDASKIARLTQGEVPIYEPGLDVLIKSNVAKGYLSFTTDLAASVSQADVVFIAVGTPTRPSDGHADLTYVMQAAEGIAKSLNGYTVVVTKSTVPVGTGRQVEARIRQTNPHAHFDMASNPEFLREGSAVEDFMEPDRVVVGAGSHEAEEIMRQLYRPLYLLATPMLFTTLESAELIKYAANAFLATKIAFINEMADLCERCGADIQDVSMGMGMDNRIGRAFLHAGPGYGGSCFPKDTLALAQTATDLQAPATIVDAVIAANKKRRTTMVNKIVRACGGSVSGKTIGILGVTFKPNTDDMRDSPSLDIIPALQKMGASIQVFDPQGYKEGHELLPGVKWCNDSYNALTGVDGAVLLTEWNEFRALDLEKMTSLMKTPLLIDLRNVYRPKDFENLNCTYVCVGRQPLKGAAEQSEAVA
ncbi:MAG: UDP-glucose 6-dehydrogenase [Candidatus Puniceispirillum sp.]|nr:UDP-glucose 6-dehydrogenase [Candidatus Puniceispirillum sp.]